MSIVNKDHSIPEGLGFRLALDMKAMTNFANLPEEGKQKLVDYIQGSTTGDDARNRVTQVVNDLHNGNSFF
jgi:hypothetical protein